MKKSELYEQLLEEALQEDAARVTSHAYWMADVISSLAKDPAFKKLDRSLREQIEQINTAVE